MPAKNAHDPALEACVTRMLTLSVNHVDTPTTDLLDEEVGLFNEGQPRRFPSLSVYPKDVDETYGWFIYIGRNWRDDDLPGCLRSCLETCERADCSVLCLESFGPVVPGLPTYAE